MSVIKWFSVLTFVLILAANVLGFMANAGMNVAHVHSTIGLLAAVAGLATMIMLLGNKQV